MSALQKLDLYPELESVQREWRTIRDEAIAALGHLTYIRDDRVIDPTAWGVLALQPEEEDLHVVPEEVRERCRRLAPRTVQLMAPIAGIRAYAFSVVSPGATIGAHRHRNAYVTALLTLQSQDAYITIAGERADFHEGEIIVFDYTLLHETINHGAVERIALLMLLDNRA